MGKIMDDADIRGMTNDVERVYNPAIDQAIERRIRSGEVAPLDYYSRLIAPGFEGDGPKQALLLMLVSDDEGVRDPGFRGRIHILFSGKEGTGKSELIDWLLNTPLSALYSVQLAGPSTSEAGLTANAAGKELTLGKLHKAHGSVLCVDEIEHLKVKEYLRNAMERGWIQFGKGKFDQAIPCRVRVVAGCNEVAKLSKPLLSRFDFCFEFDEPSPHEATGIGRKVMERFHRGGCHDEEGLAELEEYLRWVGNYEPHMAGEDMAKAITIMERYFEGRPGRTGRWITSVLRISRALAKLERRDIVPLDVFKALCLKDEEFGRAANIGRMAGW